MAKIPKYLRSSSKRKKGQKGERKAKETINSGALWFDKGDLKTADYLIEVKETSKKGYRLTTKLLEKVVSEAYTAKKKPLVMIVFPKYVCIVKIKVK
jgi:hypothetical protein